MMKRYNTMKRIVTILFLLFLSTPVFATAGWYEGCNDNIEPAEDNGTQAYYEKLVKAYHEKYPTYYDEKGVGHSYRPARSWNREVIIPLYKYIAEHPVKYRYPEQLYPTKEKLEQNKEEVRKMRREQDLEHMFGPLKRLLNISD